MINLDKFSHVILKHIISYLDNIDRICLSLICKSLFQDRDKFIQFKLGETLDPYIIDEKYVLPSFRNIIRNQFGQIPITNLFRFEENQICKVGSIPDGTTNLSFQPFFDSVIEPHSIPESVDTLNLGYKFNKPLEPNSLPPRLKTLMISMCYKQPLQNYTLPNSIETLLISYIPFSLETLPTSLVELCFVDGIPIPLKPGMLPPTLRRLTILGEYRFPLEPGDIPNTIVKLQIHPLCPLTPGAIPRGIRKLKLSGRKALQIGSIPDTVEFLSLGESYNIPLVKSIFPPALKTLVVGGNFQHQRNSELPDTITKLKISKANVLPEFLPPNLKTLVKLYKPGVALGKVPASLDTLQYIEMTDDIKENPETFKPPPPQIKTIHFVFDNEFRNEQFIQLYLRQKNLSVITITDTESTYTIRRLDNETTLVLNKMVEGYLVPHQKLLETNQFTNHKLIRAWMR
ncbi:hypothetical protein PPL_09556 [Heterostelium album PN500]|uniref:F-box domain-containing protein n=1 Tax=Heterostelium pallidum (strain ATCC 26659 / Pp 5 / PN500) TaxID=670386 RepID=D3BNE4_HETP5|nr:hypothetical protein PPL_09556 [Heterostelium album PN500]EFA76804.1 hypothetical protein PPL_09556 [Heterostelium album PN500]|eukprot:XP_020428936.1 hypothetical protein PPL_09556 [Heterostelium album PN500]